MFLSLIVLLSAVTTGVVLGIQDGWDNLMSSASSGWQQLQDMLHNSPWPVLVDPQTINSALSQLQGALTSSQAEQSALSGLSVASEVLAGAVLMLLTLFFFIKDGPPMWAFALSWVQGPSRETIQASGRQTVTTLGGYTRGIALIAVIDALLIGLGLWILQVPLVVPLTVVIFVTAFIPIIGAPIAGALAALVAVVHHIDGYILHPLIMGKTLHLHGLVVLLAVAAGTLLGGVAGAVLAVPLTAVAWAIIEIWTGRDGSTAVSSETAPTDDDALPTISEPTPAN